MSSQTAIDPFTLQPSTHKSWRTRLFSATCVRYLLAALSIAVTCYALTKILDLRTNYQYFSGKFVLKTIPYSEAVKAAITQKIDSSKALFTTGLVIVAALWGLVLAKKGERRLIMKDKPEIAMFFMAQLCLFLSFWCFHEYLDVMSSIYTVGADFKFQKPEDARIYDYRNEHLESFLRWQLQAWVCGGIVSLFTLFSAHVLKADEACPDDKSSSQSSP